MPNLFDVLALIVIAIIISVLVVDNFRIRHKYKKSLMAMVQLEIDKMAVIDTLEKSVKENELTRSDGFIRFLSESRDAAFEYIESAQQDISDFIAKADPVFSKVADEEAIKAYKKIKELLPNKTQD